MKKPFILLVAITFVIGCSERETNQNNQEIRVEENRPRVKMDTDMGAIVLELFTDIAPNHAKNFLDLANKGFYDGTTFHRVIKDFVIQGGSPDGSVTGHAGYTIPAEYSNLRHMPGTLAMARGYDPNSASCQFYICLSTLSDLDGKYTIFGQVLEGMGVVRKIGNVATDEKTEKPIEPVHMTRVREVRKGSS